MRTSAESRSERVDQAQPDLPDSSALRCMQAYQEPTERVPNWPTRQDNGQHLPGLLGSVSQSPRLAVSALAAAWRPVVISNAGIEHERLRSSVAGLVFSLRAAADDLLQCEPSDQDELKLKLEGIVEIVQQGLLEVNAALARYFHCAEEPLR